jgi:hypothetical protein
MPVMRGIFRSSCEVGIWLLCALVASSVVWSVEESALSDVVLAAGATDDDPEASPDAGVDAGCFGCGLEVIGSLDLRERALS